MASTTITQTQTPSQTQGTLTVRAVQGPIPRNNSLDQFNPSKVTPVIGTEFSKEVQLSKLLADEKADEFIKDLAVLVSQRNVVFFRAQDLKTEDQKKLGIRLGELSGKPAVSGLHIHPLTEESSPEGDQVSIITSQRGPVYNRNRKGESSLSSRFIHSDITFEKVPSDYAILKIHTNPETGGDTIWYSAYEAYDRLSPTYAKFLEGLEAYHESSKFKKDAEWLGNELRTTERGHPDNIGDSLASVHPVIRTNPVTGWKGIFVNRGFTKHIVGLNKEESDGILHYLFSLIQENHDLQVRFKWGVFNDGKIGDVAIWDNRSSFHTATWDYQKELRVGNRVVSLGEKPYFDPSSKSRREDLGLPPAL